MANKTKTLTLTSKLVVVHCYKSMVVLNNYIAKICHSIYLAKFEILEQTAYDQNRSRISLVLF